MKTFYYFCDACGADTAVYETARWCPYCHDSSSAFRLVAETTGEDPQQEVLQQIGEFRQRWAKLHTGQAVGQLHHKRRGWMRRRAR
ncbi:hypothetical protein JZ785_20160 [Alicyclobacillus curvatus]|nr:hypothetical protein JZ785_20160 [Alicyclobacillus curvatus]